MPVWLCVIPVLSVRMARSQPQLGGCSKRPGVYAQVMVFSEGTAPHFHGVDLTSDLICEVSGVGGSSSLSSLSWMTLERLRGVDGGGVGG